MNAIKAKVKARKAAEGIAELLLEELEALPVESRGHFWFVLWSKLTPPVATEPKGRSSKMTDDEAMRFGQRIVPRRFTKYVGKTVDEMDLLYCFYLAKRDPFIEDLKRYLRSNRIQREQEQRGT